MRRQLHVSVVDDLNPVVAPVCNRPMFCKPSFGLWTSTYANGKSGWVRWCEGEDFRRGCQDNWFVLSVRRNAKVYTVDMLDDLKYLIDEYPSTDWISYVGYPAPVEVQRLYGSKNYRGRVPDFERMAQDFDGLRLTAAGQCATRFTEPSLYGWDSESTLWFRWCFSAVKRLKASVL